MDKDEQKISDEAISYVKKHKKEIVEQFADLKKFPPENLPVSVFMAGSPGAGKTEFSKELVEVLFGNIMNREVVRIDADEIRNKLPWYNGTNAFLFQSAVSIAVEKIQDSVLKHNQNFILDSTLAIPPEKAKENVRRSIDKGRPVFIFYVYQDPLVAWQFTQRREAHEGRRIPREVFVKQFFQAKKTVNIVKEFFGAKVTLYIVEKNFKNKVEQVSADVDKIDYRIKFEYTKETLEKGLKMYEIP